jgi:hypothetical protein
VVNVAFRTWQRKVKKKATKRRFSRTSRPGNARPTPLSGARAVREVWAILLRATPRRWVGSIAGRLRAFTSVASSRRF